MKIFYIDDDPDEVLLFCDAVKEIDPSIDCLGLTDSKFGIESLRKNSAPDFIFLDYNMPGCSGEECLIIIRTIDHLKSVPVIIYSTGVSEPQKKRLLSIGALMVVKKHNTLAAFKTFFTEAILSKIHL
ncbi:MAG TPA: response regulator [Chryseosolibacter sp.]